MLFNEMEVLDQITKCDVQYNQLLSIIKNMPGTVFLLGLNHKYVGVNEEATRVLGIEKIEEAIGKSVQDMPFKGSELADEYKKIDHKASEGKILKTLNYHCCGKNNNELVLSLGSHTPIRNNSQKIIGIWCHGIVLPNSFLGNIHSFIQYSEKYYSRKQKQFVVDLDQTYDNLNLPPRQSEVFFFLLRGKTSKEIAHVLNVSVRSIESYIENIKFKLHCSTKSELVEKGINAGYLGILPETLFSRFQKK